MALALLALLFAGSGTDAVAQPQAGTASPQPSAVRQLLGELGSEDVGQRLRAVDRLKQTADPEAAIPLAQAIVDPDDAVQFEAIGAELNIFLAEKVVPRRRVALIIEKRDRISARSIFEGGPNLLEARPVPMAVAAALRRASHDENPRVAIEAMYAFGALADNVYGAERRELLSASAPDLAASLGVRHAELRLASVQVIARLYGWRPGDGAADQRVGDGLIVALNDRQAGIRTAAMAAIGALRYDRALQALADIFAHYGRGPVAATAVRALARIAHPSTVPLFATTLASRDSSHRVAAIEGLARSGSVAHAATITATLASERNPEVLLAGHLANVLLSDGSVDALVEGLTQPRLRDVALQYLADVAPGRVDIIGPHVQDPEPGVRIGLVEALGVSDDAQALSVVERLQHDQDPAVARAAARAAARLQTATHRP